MKHVLTDEEIVTAWRGVNFADMNAVTYARAIEAKIIERIGEAVLFQCKKGLPTIERKLNKHHIPSHWTPLYAIPFLSEEE